MAATQQRRAPGPAAPVCLRGGRGAELLDVLWAIGDKELLYGLLGSQAKSALRGACRSSRAWVDSCVSSLTIAPCVGRAPRSPRVLNRLPARLVRRWPRLSRLRVLLAKRVLCEGGCSCGDCVLGPEAVQDVVARALAGGGALPLLARQLRELTLHFLAQPIGGDDGGGGGGGGTQSPWPLPTALVPWVAAFLPQLRAIRITGCVDVAYRPLDELHAGSRPHLLYSGLSAFRHLRCLHLATPAGLHFLPLLAPVLEQLVIRRPAAAAPRHYVSVGVSGVLQGLAALTRLTSLSLEGHEVCHCCRKAPQVLLGPGLPPALRRLHLDLLGMPGVALRLRVPLTLELEGEGEGGQGEGGQGEGGQEGLGGAAAGAGSGGCGGGGGGGGGGCRLVLTVGTAGRAVGVEELVRVGAVLLQARRMLADSEAAAGGSGGSSGSGRGRRERRQPGDTDEEGSTDTSGAHSDGDGEGDGSSSDGGGGGEDYGFGLGAGAGAAAVEGAGPRPGQAAPSLRGALLAAAPLVLRVPRLVLSGRTWRPPRPQGTHAADDDDDDDEGSSSSGSSDGDGDVSDGGGGVAVLRRHGCPREPLHIRPLQAGGWRLRTLQRLRSMCMGGGGSGGGADVAGGGEGASGGTGGGGGTGVGAGAAPRAPGTWEVRQLELKAPGCVHALRQLAALLPPGSPPPPHVLLVDGAAWSGHRLQQPRGGGDTEWNNDDDEDEDEDDCEDSEEWRCSGRGSGSDEGEDGEQDGRGSRRLDGFNSFVEALRHGLPPAWRRAVRRLTVLCPPGAVRSAAEVLAAAAALPCLEVAAVAGGAHPARMLRGLAGGLAAAARGNVRPGGGGWAGLQRRGMQLQVLVVDDLGPRSRGPLSTAHRERRAAARWRSACGVLAAVAHVREYRTRLSARRLDCRGPDLMHHHHQYNHQYNHQYHHQYNHHQLQHHNTLEGEADVAVAAILLGGSSSGRGSGSSRGLGGGSSHGQLGAIPAAGPHAPDPDALLEALLGSDAELWGGLPLRNERWRVAVEARGRRRQRQLRELGRKCRRGQRGQRERLHQQQEGVAAAGEEDETEGEEGEEDEEDEEEDDDEEEEDEEDEEDWFVDEAEAAEAEAWVLRHQLQELRGRHGAAAILGGDSSSSEEGSEEGSEEDSADSLEEWHGQDEGEGMDV